jgi:hypothetical protein
MMMELSSVLPIQNAFYFFSIFIMLMIAYVGDTLGDYRDYRDGDDDDN